MIEISGGHGADQARPLRTLVSARRTRTCPVLTVFWPGARTVACYAAMALLAGGTDRACPGTVASLRLR